MSTIEVPDYLAKRFNAFATSRGLAPADALEAILDELDEFVFDDSADAPPLRMSPEGVRMVEKALEDIAAGKCRRFDPEEALREGLEIIAQHTADRAAQSSARGGQ